MVEFAKKVNYVWEQRKFSELYAKSSEKNDGSIGMDKNITVATMQFKENVKVSTAEYLKTYYTFNLGDIAFEGHQSKEFRYGRFVENDIGNGIVSHIFAVFRPIREYDLYFWKYAINNETLMQRILSRSTKASTMMHDLVTKDFLNEMFLVPSFDEQRQIGVFLATLDHLITLHQRKIGIFIKKMPIDWEQRKLGDIAEVTKLAGFEFTEHVVYSDAGNIIALRGLNIKNGQLILDDVKYIDGSNFSKLNRSKLFIDDIMLTYVGTVGEVAIIKENNRFYLAPNVSRIRVQSNDSPKFISHYMRTDNFKNKVIFPLIATSSQPALSMENIRKFMINMPKNRDEQDCLAEYFDHLDHLITLHHRKCVVLRKMKVNDWEQRKVSELFKVTRGYVLAATLTEPAKTDEMPYPVYSSQTKDNGLMGYYKDYLYEDAITWTTDGANAGTVNYRAGKFYCTNVCGVLLSNEVTANQMIAEALNNVAKGYVSYVGNPKLMNNVMADIEIMIPTHAEEREKLSVFFRNLDNLITLHHRECVILRKMKVNDWEQRKVSELCSISTGKSNTQDKSEDGEYPFYVRSPIIERSTKYLYDEEAVITVGDGVGTGKVFHYVNGKYDLHQRCYRMYGFSDELNVHYFYHTFSKLFYKRVMAMTAKTSVDSVRLEMIADMEIPTPTIEEQIKIGTYFDQLDHLITLHHHEEFCTENVLIYIEINITIQIKEDIMAELESVIEQKLIDQLVYGDSQWTYRADLKTEEDLWNNFRYILEQNNKDRLNGEPLSDTEFEQVKNQLQFSSFYKAGEWLVGENGKVMVHVQRDTERLHLVVMNHEHIAGGSSVYEVINQYRALADEESQTKAQDRRFDVTLMINGLPMIHIELKNKQHSYMDGFWQIKKYIGEGKFTGIFSAVQMFVISNGVDTKYFSAASDTELNPKFISGWLDNENNPVPDYLDFAKSVLRIPEAHEMIARYTVLDEEAKRLILLRPYQIHAIEAIREASKMGKSGFVWHTTGSGKTLTSYKATRNLLMDIPSIDKAIFLIDRKDLDTQTSMAFQTYANNDLVDVDKTDNVFELKKKLKSDDRQMIVTTIQKLQRLITKKLAEGTPEYNKIKSLKLAFVVDECHRAVTPGTKRELERFFANSLWYGFTGTPRFAENPYPQLGDLPRTTEELYGERLHRYTIQNAIHDNAVLGFQVEHNGPKNMDDETDSSMYENETHMLRVLDVILNKSYHKLGFQNGKGKTYEGLLTTSSIQLAQKYYELLKRVKNGETELQIDEKVKQILPDFPKFAITYSVTENEEGSHLNQEKMKESINDYNEMFGTKLDISQIQSYNANLNKRLARKEPKFQSRSEQLDLVIVVDRLLTGFDAPCMSTLFVDRQPMGPHDLIQAFSRTNRIFDKNKTYGQIVTFQAPKLFKECVDNAVKLYSAGSTEIALLAEWEEIEPAFRKALKALRVSAETPAEIPAMSEKEKVLFVKAFQNFDKLFAQLKSFTQYEDSMLTEYGISEDEYDDYAGHYLNVKEELKAGAEDTQSEMEEQPIDVDYELMAYSNTKIDYEYIINLIQNIVTPDEDVEITPEERQKQLEEVKQYIDDLRKENPKVADIMSTLVSEIEQDEVKYKGQSILNIVENMKHECIEKVVMDFSITWYVSKDDVMYAATHYRNGEIPNESAIKSTADFTSFKEAQERAIPKFKYYNMMIEELRKTLEEEIKPLLNN